MIAAFGVINLHWLNTDYPRFFGFDATFPGFAFGKYGVQLFFVLSGFLITEILLTEIYGNPAKALKAFILRRMLRLLPVYYLFLMFLVAVDDEYVIQHFPWFALYAANIRFFLSGGLVDVWSNHLWTLSIEEQFYVAFPFLLLLVGAARVGYLFVVLIVSSILFSIVMTWHGHNSALLIFSQMDMLAGGAMLALLKVSMPARFAEFQGRAALLGCGLALCLSVCLFYQRETLAYGETWFDAVLLITCVGLVWLGVNGFPDRLGSVFSLPIFQYLGKVSYGLYVYHKVVPLVLLIFMGKLDMNLGSLWVYYFVNLSLLLIVTHLSWVLIEAPCLRLKSNFSYDGGRENLVNGGPKSL